MIRRGSMLCHYRTDIIIGSAPGAEPTQPARVSPKRTLLVVRIIARLLPGAYRTIVQNACQADRPGARQPLTLAG